MLGCDVGCAKGMWAGCAGGGLAGWILGVWVGVGGWLGWCVVGEGSVEAAAWWRGGKVWWEDVELLLSWWCGFDFLLVLNVSGSVCGVEELRL